MAKEMSKRVQRDRNNKLPMSSRTPGSHGCSDSDLGSSGVTDCPAVVQTRTGPKPSFTARHEEGLSRAPRTTHQESSACVLDLSQQIVFAQPSKKACEVALLRPGHSRPRQWSLSHTSNCPRPTFGGPMHQLPTLLSSTTLRAKVLQRMSPPPQHVSSNSHL